MKPEHKKAPSGEGAKLHSTLDLVDLLAEGRDVGCGTEHGGCSAGIETGDTHEVSRDTRSTKEGDCGTTLILEEQTSSTGTSQCDQCGTTGSTFSTDGEERRSVGVEDATGSGTEVNNQATRGCQTEANVGVDV